MSSLAVSAAAVKLVFVAQDFFLLKMVSVFRFLMILEILPGLRRAQSA
jgi:hypothetical protein